VLQAGRTDPDVVAAHMRALQAQGEYEEAAELAAAAAEAFAEYFPIQVQAVEVLRAGGRSEQAEAVLKGLNELAKEANPKTLNAVELVALGRAALLLGAEPKMVMSQFFERARRLEPEAREGYLATAELALEKADYALAAKVLNEGRTKLGPLPELIYLQALAYSPSERGKAEDYLTEALEINPRHGPSLLLRAEHAIDFEDYDRAREVLEELWETNPHHPLAGAAEAAIAFILDDREAGERARERALKTWAGNPEVDYRIGQNISQMRRFEEGAAFLRRALEADPGHLPSKKALGQDLLRMGRDVEGWKLIKEVQAVDKYDVETYNLMLLHDQLATFETLRSGQFVVRMREDEARVYGARVIALLEEANEVLGEKYGYRPEEDVVVDFFPDQQDFAVRTLGMPGGLGILGACFGNVVAMNSPGSPGALGSNWESTLWHEYCHTVTLGATAGRIPRWLTEGISVYEERQRDPSCASKMNPEFRKRILEEGGVIPIERLSAALTAFSDPETISFAYYQASLLVEYLLEEYGSGALREVLDELRENGVVEEVLAKRMAGLQSLNDGFLKQVQGRARAVAPEVDWALPDPDSPLRRDPDGVAAYLEEHPNSFWALTVHGGNLLAEERWEAAKEPARKLIALFPGYVGVGNGYAILARACRNLEQEDEERKALRGWVERDGAASEACLRLLELDLAAKDWEALRFSSRRLLEVNPLLPSPHRALGLAAQEQGDAEEAIGAFETLLHLDPLNPADVHFRLASLYKGADAGLARRHVLQALEEAPRYREAHRLLLELQRGEGVSEAAE
jgi:tetratricopeptide (TPR) repeat protein